MGKSRRSDNSDNNESRKPAVTCKNAPITLDWSDRIHWSAYVEGGCLWCNGPTRLKVEGGASGRFAHKVCAEEFVTAGGVL